MSENNIKKSKASENQLEENDFNEEAYVKLDISSITVNGEERENVVKSTDIKEGVDTIVNIVVSKQKKNLSKNE